MIMKKMLLYLAVSVSGQLVQVKYRPTDNGSSVQFKIKNLGFNVTGSFSGLDGTVAYDPARPTETVFDVSVDANSINTDNNMRDNHLREDTYFDVKKYPRIRFVSVKVTSSTRRNEFFVFGKLMIKDHSKDISFPFTVTPSGPGYLFKGSFTINRKDFGVGGASIVSDNLDVLLSIQAQ